MMLNKVYKFGVVFIGMLLVLGLTLLTCTCQQPTETGEASTPPEELADGMLTFEAAEYVNEEYKFSVKYPKEWLQQPSEEPTAVFRAAAEKRVPALSIYVLDGVSFGEALAATLSFTGSDIKIVDERVSTLMNGAPASEAVVKWKTQGFEAETFALGVQKGDKWVIVAVTTVSLLARYNEPLFSEVAHTLQFK